MVQLTAQGTLIKAVPPEGLFQTRIFHLRETAKKVESAEWEGHPAVIIDALELTNEILPIRFNLGMAPNMIDYAN